MTISRRTLGATALAALLPTLWSTPSSAAAFPNHAVRFIVPWTAGGGGDSLARQLGRGLSELWGQPVVVDNKPGADATIGIQALTMLPADGYSIAVIITSHAVHPSVRKSLPYDLLKDFVAVSDVAEAPNLLVVNPALSVHNVLELIALSKTRNLNYAAPGLGGPGHLGGVMFNALTGANAVMIPYAGGAPALMATMRGEVDFMFTTMLSGMPLAHAGKVRPIAITSAQRSPLFPDLPTVTESGLKDFELVTWYGVIARAGTPKAIVDQLARDISRVVKEPTVAAQLASEGTRVIASGPDVFGPYLNAEVKKWADVVRQAHIEPQ